jgi:siderophore-iron reductase FhuF
MIINPRQDDITHLIKHYRLCVKPMESELSIPCSHFSEEAQLRNYLVKVQEKIKAPNLTVAASMFSKRYSYAIIVPLLYSMSVFHKRLNERMDNCYLETDDEAENWLPYLRLVDRNCYPMEKRDERDKGIEAIFKNNINIVWNNLVKVTSISKAILWENTATYVFWIYEKTIKETNGTFKKLIQDDYHYVVKEASGTLFGEKENPLYAFFSEKSREGKAQELIRKRKTCCLYHLVDSKGNFCSTCPSGK